MKKNNASHTTSYAYLRTQVRFSSYHQEDQPFKVDLIRDHFRSVILRLSFNYAMPLLVVEGEEQLDWPNCQTCMEYCHAYVCCIILFSLVKNYHQGPYSLNLLLQKNFHYYASIKELHYYGSTKELPNYAPLLIEIHGAKPNCKKNSGYLETFSHIFWGQLYNFVINRFVTGLGKARGRDGSCRSCCCDDECCCCCYGCDCCCCCCCSTSC